MASRTGWKRDCRWKAEWLLRSSGNRRWCAHLRPMRLHREKLRALLEQPPGAAFDLAVFDFMMGQLGNVESRVDVARCDQCITLLAPAHPQLLELADELHAFEPGMQSEHLRLRGRSGSQCQHMLRHIRGHAAVAANPLIE